MPADWRDLEGSIGIHSDSNHGHVGPNLESKPPRGNRFGARSVVVSRDNLDGTQGNFGRRFIRSDYRSPGGIPRVVMFS